MLGWLGHLLKPCFSISISIFQGREGVAAALAACKIIKEMSHLEKEAEVARTMREAKYEQLALGESQADCGPLIVVWPRVTPMASCVEQNTDHFLLGMDIGQEVEALTILREKGKGQRRSEVGKGPEVRWRLSVAL